MNRSNQIDVAVALGLIRSSLTIREPDDLLAMEFDNSDNLLGDRLLAKGQSLVIAGPGGIGKSRMLLQLATSHLCGQDFVSLQTHGENHSWLILQAENSNRRLQFDLTKLKEWVSPDQWSFINENLKIHTLETDDDFLLGLANNDVQERIREVTQTDLTCLACFTSMISLPMKSLPDPANSSVPLRSIPNDYLKALR